ncbi:hypothetical protein [Pseudophaeobacter sp.]|uniref:hypothetical protein n=1 Tax=Pseudophaeobacter sp. TaxID=1971739 RepID=UPI003A985E30
MSKAFLITYTDTKGDFVSAGVIHRPGAWEACAAAEKNLPPEAVDFHVERIPPDALEKLIRWRSGTEAMPVFNSQ